MKSALLLFSGGQDSTTALVWARQRFDKVSAISFDFGQTHTIELESAKSIAEHYNIPHTTLSISSLYAEVSSCSLLKKEGMLPVSSEEKEGIPDTFVPGRNLLFLNIAAIHAFAHGISDIIIGVSEVDYSGYPDCREGFLQSAEKSISLAFDQKFHIHAPFLHCSKAEEIQLLQKAGELDILKKTHTCYRGERPPCGQCDACRLRAEAFLEAGAEDPLAS